MEVKEALSRKYLEQAIKIAAGRRTKTGERSAILSAKALPKDRSPQMFRLVLPASLIADFESALSMFKLQQFALNSDKEVGYVEFFEQLLERETKPPETTESKKSV